MELLDKIRSRKARTGVIGLGYVGLPLAIEFAHAGFRAVGIDVDQRKVDAVNAGQSYIVDTASEEIASLNATGRLSATNEFAVIAECDTINIFVSVESLMNHCDCIDPSAGFVELSACFWVLDACSL